MKTYRLASKKTVLLAERILGDKYKQFLGHILDLDGTKNKVHIPVLAKFVVEGVHINEIAKYYKMFQHSKLWGLDFYKYKTFNQFKKDVDQQPISDEYLELLELDDTVGKYDVDRLYKFKKDNNLSIDLIKYYYKSFVDNLEKDKDFNDYQTFQELEADVDAYGEEVFGPTSTEEKMPSIYNDSNIEVFLGDSKRKCVELSDGYSFCVGRPDVGQNMFAAYRFQGSTFYFIRFLKNNDYIVVNALPNDKYTLTLKENRGDIDISKEQLIERYPDLKPLFDNDVIKHKPLSDEEKKSLKKVSEMMNDREFVESPYGVKRDYIDYGHRLSLAKFESLDADLKNLYINVTSEDLPRELKESIKGTPLEKRYWDRAAIRGDIKLKRKLYHFLTEDEFRFVKNDDRMSDFFVKELTHRGGVPYFMKEWLGEKMKNNDPPKWLKPVFEKDAHAGFMLMYIGSIKMWYAKLLDQNDEWAIGILSSYYRKNHRMPDDVDMEHLANVMFRESPIAHEEWVKVTNEIITNNKDPLIELPDFATKWASDKMLSGDYPPEWIESIKRNIMEDGEFPYFAYEWMEKSIDYANPPTWLIEAVRHYTFNAHGYLPLFFMYTGLENYLNRSYRGVWPQWLSSFLDEYILKYHSIPNFAESRYYEFFRENIPTGDMIRNVKYIIEKTNKPPPLLPIEKWIEEHGNGWYNKYKNMEKVQNENIQGI